MKSSDARHEDIARRAYVIWEQEGRPENQAWEHWLRAEAQWREASHHREKSHRTAHLEAPPERRFRSRRYGLILHRKLN
jgi:hypothetical protein